MHPDIFHFMYPSSQMNGHTQSDLITISNFPSAVEQIHSQTKKVLKLGVLYCKENEFNREEIAANSAENCSPEFLKFLDILGIN